MSESPCMSINSSPASLLTAPNVLVTTKYIDKPLQESQEIINKVPCYYVSYDVQVEIGPGDNGVEGFLGQRSSNGAMGRCREKKGLGRV